MKKCTKCGITKAVTAFAKDPSRRDGRHSRCKKCVAAIARKRRRQQKKKIPVIPATIVCSHCHKEKPSSEFHKNSCRPTSRSHQCKACALAIARQQRQKQGDTAYNRANTRKYRLKQLYGLSIEDYNAWRLQQGNCCALCSRTFEGNKIHVDHDHETGQLRGLLCPKCNVGLGLFNDDPALLTTALKYLTRARTKHMSG